METDPSILQFKAESALKTYGHQLVVGNLLSNHKDKVILYLQNKEQKIIEKSDEEKKAEMDIEKHIVAQIALLHQNFCEFNNVN